MRVWGGEGYGDQIYVCRGAPSLWSVNCEMRGVDAGMLVHVHVHGVDMCA